MPTGWVGRPGMRSSEDLQTDRWGCAFVWVVCIAIAIAMLLFGK